MRYPSIVGDPQTGGIADRVSQQYFLLAFPAQPMNIKNSESNIDGANLVNEGKDILQNSFEIFFRNGMVTRGKVADDCKSSLVHCEENHNKFTVR